MAQMDSENSFNKTESGVSRASHEDGTVYSTLSFHNDDATVPVPELIWTNNKRFWKVMCEKDNRSLSLRDPILFEKQQYITAKMRAILLEWLSEVAQLLNFHRKTYYLTIDYIDRYLTKDLFVLKNQLQLVGVTCLFIAAKMEEIYPPKIEEFASLTDGACTRDEIFDMEVIVVQRLEWMLTPVTISCWLEMFLQFMYKNPDKTEATDTLLPKFSGTLLKRLFQLVDLALLDATSLKFSYGVISTSAIYILVGPDVAFNVSALRFNIIEPCVQWLSVYQKILNNETPQQTAINLKDLPPESFNCFHSKNSPRIHTHTTDIELYKIALIQFEVANKQTEYTETTTKYLETPPSSIKKSRHHTESSPEKNSLSPKRIKMSAANTGRKRQPPKRCRKKLPMKRKR